MKYVNKHRKTFLAYLITTCMLISPLTACTDDNNDKINSSLNGSTSTGDNENSSGGPIAPDNITGNKYFDSYSKILQTVIKGTYYNDVIEYETKKYLEQTGFGYNTDYDNYCENIPYGFLNEIGYDINEIKLADNSAVTSEVYILDNEPNNLYIKCAVLNKSTIDYYDTYLLKYQLDQKELYDLNRLFDMQACGFISAKRALYQAPFFIQELSYQKEAEIIAHSYMEAKTFNWFKNCIDEEFITTTRAYRYEIDNKESQGMIPIILQNCGEYDTSDTYGNLFNMSFSYNTYKPYSKNDDELLRFKAYVYDNIKLYTSQFKEFGKVYNAIDNKDIIDLTSESNAFVFTYKSNPQIDNTKATPQTATFYNVHDCPMLNGLEPNLTHVYVNSSSWLYNEMSADQSSNSNK